MALRTLWPALALACLTACGDDGKQEDEPSGDAGAAAQGAAASAQDGNTGGTGGAVATGEGGSPELPTAGTTGQTTAGAAGGARVGTAGQATGGADGQATGGTQGEANGGTEGEATGGTQGEASGGTEGEATGGTQGEASGGTAGQATGGTEGQATGGAAGQATGGTEGQATGGAAGQPTGGAGGSGGVDCQEIQCLRPYECVWTCGDEEVLNNGCCPCPDGMIDTIACPTPTVTQGVSGSVLWLEGNHMPGAGGSSSGITLPVSREVRVYEVVSASDVVAATDRPEAYGVYDTVNATLVETTTSDPETGYYEVALDPGTYSIFVEDGGDWYCNGMSAEGLCPITVEAGAVASYQIRIDYAAAY